MTNVDGELETRTVYVCPGSEMRDNVCADLEAVHYGTVFLAVQERRDEQGKITWQNCRYFACSLAFDAQNSAIMAMELLNHHWPEKDSPELKWVLDLSWHQEAQRRNSDFIVGKSRLMQELIRSVAEEFF